MEAREEICNPSQVTPIHYIIVMKHTTKIKQMIPIQHTPH